MFIVIKITLLSAMRLERKLTEYCSDGIPFIIISSQELQCQYGHPKNYNSKVSIINPRQRSVGGGL